jgi:superfamily I DNA/RNA helicase
MESFDPSQQHAIIARNNATLFEHAVEALETKESFALVGGADELIRLVKSGYALYCGNHENVRDDELRNYSDWAELREISDLTQDASMRHLVMLIEKYKGQSVEFCRDLEVAGKNDEREAHKILTTAHKSKGREWRQTKLCEDLEINKDTILKLATESEITSEENEAMNLLYVAITRCQSGLELDETLKRNLQMMRRTVQAIEQDQKTSNNSTLKVG